MKSYIALDGECISSIAFSHGFHPDTLWNLPENEKLQQLREDLHVLAPGDIVYIPDLRVKHETGATDAVHTFRRRGVPEKLKIRFLLNGKPRATIPWTLTIGRRSWSGQTDADGSVIASIAPDAGGAELTLRPPGETEERYKVALRWIDPVNQVRGQQTRLRNLGYYAGPVDGEPRVEFENAVRSFQMDQKLDAAGQVDDSTASALKEAHGC